MWADGDEFCYALYWRHVCCRWRTVVWLSAGSLFSWWAHRSWSVCPYARNWSNSLRSNPLPSFTTAPMAGDESTPLRYWKYSTLFSSSYVRCVRVDFEVRSLSFCFLSTTTTFFLECRYFLDLIHLTSIEARWKFACCPGSFFIRLFQNYLPVMFVFRIMSFSPHVWKPVVPHDHFDRDGYMWDWTKLQSVSIFFRLSTRRKKMIWRRMNTLKGAHLLSLLSLSWYDGVSCSPCSCIPMYKVFRQVRCDIGFEPKKLTKSSDDSNALDFSPYRNVHCRKKRFRFTLVEYSIYAGSLGFTHSCGVICCFD